MERRLDCFTKMLLPRYSSDTSRPYRFGWNLYNRIRGCRLYMFRIVVFHSFIRIVIVITLHRHHILIMSVPSFFCTSRIFVICSKSDHFRQNISILRSTMFIDSKRVVDVSHHTAEPRVVPGQSRRTDPLNASNWNSNSTDYQWMAIYKKIKQSV